MVVIEFILGVLTKIAVAALIIFTLHPHTSNYTPPPLTKPNWQLDEDLRITTRAELPTSSPLIVVPTKNRVPAKTATTQKINTPVKIPPATTSTPTVTTPLSPVIIPQSTGNDLNSKTRDALVNILCLAGNGDVLRPISGSGVIIDPKGVVLTNAHIGQFFLLRDYPSKDSIQCVLRTGSPASPMYTAELLYFPQKWLDANAKKIVEENPTGTGEFDYALLVITGRTSGSPLPDSFPYLPPYVGDDMKVGDTELLAAYPAGFLQGATITTNLYVSSAVGVVRDVFTFHEGGGIDLISIPGTVVSQKGSSGGAVVRSDGKLTGLIATATSGDSTSQRDLRAITLRHIDISLIDAKRESLSELLSGDVRSKADMFSNNTAPTMSKVYFDILNNN